MAKRVSFIVCSVLCFVGFVCSLGEWYQPREASYTQRCRKDGLCVRFALKDQRYHTTKHFTPRATLFFAFRLNKEGCIALLNIDHRQRLWILDPDRYHQTKHDKDVRTTRKAQAAILHILPTPNDQKLFRFLVNGEVGDEEWVLLLADTDCSRLNLRLAYLRRHCVGQSLSRKQLSQHTKGLVIVPKKLQIISPY